jgi:hypothetical protein
VGIDTTGDPIWEVFGGFKENAAAVDLNFVPVPDCTGWDWELPAMPDQYALCGPPETDADCLWMYWLDGDMWRGFPSHYIRNKSYTYCRRVESAELGPQKEPSSVARIAAQLRQVLMDLEDLEVIDVD